MCTLLSKGQFETRPNFRLIPSRTLCTVQTFARDHAVISVLYYSASNSGMDPELRRAQARLCGLDSCNEVVPQNGLECSECGRFYHRKCNRARPRSALDWVCGYCSRGGLRADFKTCQTCTVDVVYPWKYGGAHIPYLLCKRNKIVCISDI